MRTFIKRALWGTLLAGGLTLAGASVAMAAEIDGDDTLTFSAARAIEPAPPTATKYSSWRRVKRRSIG